MVYCDFRLIIHNRVSYIDSYTRNNTMLHYFVVAVVCNNMRCAAIADPT